MFTQLKQILGMGPSVDIGEMIRQGAIILDVRTKGEFQSGHAKGSINIPLQQLGSSLGKLDPAKPVITCCASGMRSGSAASLLRSHGFKTVHNGGSWQNVQRHL